MKWISHHLKFSVLLMAVVAMLCLWLNDVGAQEARQETRREKTFNVSGNITDVAGEAMIGVAVAVEGGQTGTISDGDGNFSLTLPASAQTLVFSFVGYNTQKITVNVDNKQIGADNKQISAANKQIKVVMTENTVMLDESIVVGYMTQSRSNVTTAISSIKAADISGYTGSSVEQSISGLIPGVRIATADAIPGGDIDVQVRGIGTVTSGTAPLYIVDGIQIDGGLMSLNPDDIADIQILKDAASAAIYGSRGANGVFIVTTKRGQKGKTIVTINSSTSFSDVQRRYSVMDTPQLIEYLDASGINRRYFQTTNQTQDYFPFREDLSTDWQDAIFRTAVVTKNNISVSGGNDGVRFRVSGEFFDQPGTVVYTYMKRYTFRSNLDINISKNLKMAVNLSPSRTTNRGIKSGAEGSDGVLRSAIAMYPFFPVRLPDGELFSTVEYAYAPQDVNAWNPATGKFPTLQDSPLADNIENPIKIARDYKILWNTNRIVGGISFDWRIVEGLNFRPSLSVDMSAQNREEWVPSTLGKGRSDSSASNNSTKRTMFSNENVVEYKHDFGKHHVDGVVGMSVYQLSSEFLTGSANRFSTEALPSINGGIPSELRYDYNDERMASFFSHLTYAYERKYLFSAIYRADGSSKFGPNNRFAHFPSLSAGWVISEEAFMKSLKAVSELKLRASWGVSGNNDIGNYNYYTRLNKNYYVVGGKAVTGWAPGNIGNPDLAWEKSEQLNLGIDLGFLRNRISLQADFYHSKTTDMLHNATIPSTLGQSRMLMNVGTVLNKGLELNIVSRNLVNKFKWTTSFNISFNKNEVLALGVDSEALYDGMADSNVTLVGYPVGMFWGRLFRGIYQSMDEIEALGNDPYSGLGFDPNARPGDCKWVDLNGDGIIDDDDRAIIGNPHPKFIAGMVNTFRYRHWSLSIQLNGQYGNDIYNYALMQFLRGTDTNKSTLLVDRWRSESNPGNGIADRTTTTNDVRPTTEKNKFSNRLLEDGSFLTIKNIGLSYTFNHKLVNRIGLRDLTTSFNIDNLHTFSRYTGLNPEANSMRSNTAPGIDLIAYPQARNYTFSLHLTF